ncbi:uncharacterized protein LOC134183611 isoform X2 [Corticium candelabrum]|uniref:uncharacterized protein LOC134183611 isoform X2 n=1 Tax=Corticium candelabrum TaxID=121492 RepID=UPI002E266BB8|nr:uncharacterized protein LOC134183611 isoform X2 [Corticium candelabrum]
MDLCKSGDHPVAPDQKYPYNKSYFTWGELRCLARCLGFQDFLFKKFTPKEYQLTEGLPDNVLFSQIDLKAYDPALHQTVNNHNAEYNRKVLRKAARMLRGRKITFATLRDARVAFFLYESENMSGIKADEKILLRALKLCNHIASPLHLTYEVRHMKDLHITGSLQLYEFLDLVLICRLIDDQKLANSSGSVSQWSRKNELYKMDDFEDIFITEEERMINYLDKQFQLSIFRPQRDLPALLPNPMEATSVSGDTRREMAAAARLAAKPLRPAVRVSNRKVESMRHSRTSRDCCSPCPPVVSVEDATGGNRRHRNGDEDCRVGDDIRGRDIPVSQWHCQPVVSQNEIDEHRILMESLEWDLMLKEQSGHVFEEAKVTV